MLATTALMAYVPRTLSPYVRGGGPPRMALPLGWTKGSSVVASSLVLILYNLALIRMTWCLSQLCEEDVRSRVSPVQ